jgi:hypothetical protein
METDKKTNTLFKFNMCCNGSKRIAATTNHVFFFSVLIIFTAQNNASQVAKAVSTFF